MLKIVDCTLFELELIVVWKRIQQPSIIVVNLFCVVFIILLELIHLWPTIDNYVEKRRTRLETEDAISITKECLTKGDFASAFDMVMVFSRLAPSDPRLFDLVVEFIEKAKPSDDDELISMAEDLLDRGDSLVHFQSPANVESSRKRLSNLRQTFFKAATPNTSSDPLDSIRKLLVVAADSSVLLSVRSLAVEQARSALADAQLSQSLSGPDKADKSKLEELQKLDDQIDKSEKQCITELYLQSKSRSAKWLSDVSVVSLELQDTPPEKVPDLSKRISDLLTQGFNHMQELTPFYKSDVEGSSEFFNNVEKQVKLLQRHKSWLYNQQTLRLVREIESKKEWTAEDKIRPLAKVSEELLSPYVLRRHNELWDKVFESLPDEEKKVWAVRLRILRQFDKETESND
jgi:hypothetical protein